MCMYVYKRLKYFVENMYFHDYIEREFFSEKYDF